MAKKKQTKSEQWLVPVLIAMLAISLGYVAYTTLNVGTRLSVGEVRESGGQAYFVPPLGFVEQNVFRVDGIQTIVIGRDCRAIVADTSPERAEAIKDGLEGRVSGRPTAYDQWADSLETFGIILEAVTIHDFDGNVYLSTGVFRQGSSVLELDMRPSDALALAPRAQSPIYISSDLLARFGEDIC